MKQFVPRDKMSKKARKELDKARRAEWHISPVTRKVESKKQYDRRKISRIRKEEWTGDFLLEKKHVRGVRLLECY